MRAFERILEQPLPPLNPSVLWLNTSKNPAILCHFRDGKWCPMSDIDFSTIQGEDKEATLTAILRKMDFTYETVTESVVRSMWGLAIRPSLGTQGYIVGASLDTNGYIVLEGMNIDIDGYLIIYND